VATTEIRVVGRAGFCFLADADKLRLRFFVTPSDRKTVTDALPPCRRAAFQRFFTGSVALAATRAATCAATCSTSGFQVGSKTERYSKHNGYQDLFF